MTFHRNVLGAAALALSLAACALPAHALSYSGYGDVYLTADEAYLSTAATESGETTISGSSALLYTDLEGSLGLSASGATLGADTWEGSALQLSFSTSTALRVSFDWWLGTVDAYDAGFADRAFVVIDGSTVLTLAELTAAAQTGTYTVDFGAGSHTLAVGIVDVNDASGVSALVLGGLSITAAPVPEPQTWALWLGGLGLLGAAARRRRG